MFRLDGFLLALLLLTAPASASAADCALSRVASLDVVDAQDGGILVPVGINGTELLLELDLAAERSVLSAATADRLKLTRSRLPREMLFYHLSAAVHDGATVAIVALGGATGRDMLIPVVPALVTNDPRAAGQLGLDLLSNFDVELDPASHKLNLFSPDHCQGQVVYWATSFTSVPLTVKGGILSVPVTLDGQGLTAGINTVRAASFLPLQFAVTRFKLDRSMPSVVPAADAAIRVPSYAIDIKPYRYAFTELTLQAFAIRAPSVLIYEFPYAFVMNGVYDPQCNNRVRIMNVTSSLTLACGIDLYLGMQDLRKMHTYFAFKEGVLYLTAADAK